jgi:DNA polymerase-3 subunit epsilon
MNLIGVLLLSREGRFPATPVEFTALDFRTTGLRPGHVIEVGAVRVRADGTVVGEFSTLVNPGFDISPGPVSIHRISRRDLDNAPEFGAVLGQVLDLCRGSVLAAHNLPFQEQFLAAELGKLGVLTPSLPGVCTLAAAGAALRLPNYHLATVAGALGIGDFPGHLALASARICACVVSSLVTTHGLAFTERPQFPQLPQLAITHLSLPRPDTAVPDRTWLTGLLERLPVSDAGDPLVEAYRDFLTAAIADQYISPDEARELAAFASDAGVAVRRTHLDFVTAMRRVAEDDGVVTPAEARDLGRVAEALGVPEAVRDLYPAARTETPPRVLVLGETKDADNLRAAVLAAGIQLAKNLTTSVSHLAIADDVPRHDPRLGRARDRGIVILDVHSAWTVLGLVNPAPTFVPPSPPALVPAPTHGGQVWGARALMAAGLFVMFVSVAALFGGAPFLAGFFLALFGVAALFGGWYLSEPAQGT